MRYSRVCLAFVASLSIASSAAAVTMAWTPVGNPGNACDPQDGGCFGGVGYAYNIGTYEVTNAQYAEFLNAVADTDTNALYDTSMGDPVFLFAHGGIARAGVAGSYTYSTSAGREDMPVIHVSFYDATRFVNWLHNGQPIGGQDASTTEDGAYTITAQGIADNSISRNAGTEVFLPSEDEWYKAAYYDGSSASYFDYPAGSDAQVTCAAPNGASNQANCPNAVGDLTPVGSYTGSASPYGTFDQGGNVFEWNEATFDDGGIFNPARGVRGGDFDSAAIDAGALSQLYAFSEAESRHIGFRVASAVPEPSTGLLMIGGLLGLAGWRRMRA